MGEIVISRQGAGEVITAGPTSTSIRVPGVASEGALSLVEMKLAPGWGGPPPHVHAKMDHIWRVLDGSVDLLVDGEKHRCEEGDCLFVPAGVPHGFSTIDTGGATILEVDTPALDDYFRELGKAFPDGGPPDPAVVAEIMGRFDTAPVV